MSFLKPKAAKSTSSSYNVNNDLIKSTYGGMMSQGTGATNFLAQLLGVSPMGGGGGGGGSTSTAYSGPSWEQIQAMKNDGIAGNYKEAMAAWNAAHANGSGYADAGAGTGGGSGGGDAMAGLNNYLQLAGFAPAMRQLSQNITGQGAAAGILNSGSTAKALQSRGAELNNQFFNNYMQQLAGLSGLGLQAGGLVTNAGQKTDSKSTGGGPSTLGSIASTVGGIASIFSDPRLKEDVEHVRTDPDGLEWISFRYKGAKRRWIGVMADQVRKLRPHALGPKIGGFDTVNYGAL